jgi:hypothetical protein
VPPAAAASAPYRVVDSITSTVGIDDACFVFKVADGLFDHVATVLDMHTYPDNVTAAQNANLPYYRQASVTKDFSDVNIAKDFADTLKSRLTSLAKEYDLSVTAFVGQEVGEVLPPP